MKRLPLIVLCCAIAAPVPAAAAKDVPQQAAAAPNWPSVKYEEKRPAVLRSGDLVVTLDTEPGSKPEYRVPTFKGVYQGRPIFTVRMPEKEDTDPEFAARVVRLDPKTALPQVVMTAYTYDAHCCIATRIATAISPDSWEIVDAPPLDGEQGYVFRDIDGDGTAEMISFDQNFFYSFACYPCSYPPTRIAKLSGTQITDVTADPEYRGFLREVVAGLEKYARGERKLWHENGFLAGWVAAKSLVGQVDDAWKRMLASYDRKADWPMETCTTGAAIDKCPKDKLRQMSFPEALNRHLAELGYPTPKAMWR